MCPVLIKNESLYQCIKTVITEITSDYIRVHLFPVSRFAFVSGYYCVQNNIYVGLVFLLVNEQ